MLKDKVNLAKLSTQLANFMFIRACAPEKLNYAIYQLFVNEETVDFLRMVL